MRANSQNEGRNRYNRIVAAARAAEVTICGRTGKPGPTLVVVEAEDMERWDDILEKRAVGGVVEEHRWQVKRQSTKLGKDEFLAYVAEIDPTGAVTHHFAVPQDVEVESVGSLRVLRALAERASQPGASASRVVAGKTKEEGSWIAEIRAKCGGTDSDAVARISRLRVHILGLEDVIVEHAQDRLAAVFGPRAPDAWDKILGFVADKDGVVEVTWTILEPLLSPLLDQADSEITALYQTFIQDVEERFWLNGWPGLSDNLVRNIVPIDWVDDVRRLRQLHATTTWPGTHPKFEAALANLLELAEEFIRHFLSNSEETDTAYRQNKDYKRIYPNPRYQEAVEAAKLWDKGALDRLHNMVAALNEFADAVRGTVSPNYRLKGGKFAIHDSLGVTARGLEGVYWVPTDYVDWD